MWYNFSIQRVRCTVRASLFGRFYCGIFLSAHLRVHSIPSSPSVAFDELFNAVCLLSVLYISYQTIELIVDQFPQRHTWRRRFLENVITRSVLIASAQTAKQQWRESSPSLGMGNANANFCPFSSSRKSDVTVLLNDFGSRF